MYQHSTATETQKHTI